MSDSANERVPVAAEPGDSSEDRELPRPATPGPWPADFVYEAVRHIERNCDFIESQTNPDFWWDRYKDAPAIAALPEWIEDRDRWKARAEQAEAALTDVWQWAVASRGVYIDDKSSYGFGREEAARMLLRRLAKHGYEAAE